MAQTATAPAATTVPPRRQPTPRRGRRERPNWPAGVLASIWLVLVVVPLYYLVSASFRSRQDYLSSNPLKPPADPTLENYRTVFEGGFVTYLVNNLVVTLATVAIHHVAPAAPWARTVAQVGAHGASRAAATPRSVAGTSAGATRRLAGTA